MHKSIPAVACALAIAFPVSSAWATAATAPAAKPKPKKKVVVSTMRVTGPSVDMRWGPVQVTVVIKKTTTTIGKKKTVAKRITDVTATYPTEKHRSQEINSQAIPYLRQEVLTAQSARINIISEATMTSDAYAQSLQAALDQAKF